MRSLLFVPAAGTQACPTMGAGRVARVPASAEMSVR
jgi:hypothetical protein